MSDISQEDFEFYQSMLLKKSGLALPDNKSYLLLTRLTPIALSLGYKDMASFTKDLRTSSDPALMRSVIEAMTTNETSFFRDMKPFTMLRDLLPDLINARNTRKTIRIWSAACSSGQECYSLAMMLDEFFADKPGWNYQIIGTDISNDILTQAKRGEYNQFEIQRGLSIQMMIKYFTQDGTTWRIKDAMKNKIQFQQANLLENMAHLGTFDVIFCRNVLIYFNNETKTDVLNKIAPRLANDGLLFLGACETAINLPVPFKTIPDKHGVMQLHPVQPVRTMNA